MSEAEGETHRVADFEYRNLRFGFNLLKETRLNQQLHARDTHLWSEIDDPVELDDEARLSLTEAETVVGFPGAASKIASGETATFPHSMIFLEFATLYVSRGGVCK